MSQVCRSLERSQTSRRLRRMSLRSVKTIARANQKRNVLSTLLFNCSIDERYNVVKEKNLVVLKTINLQNIVQESRKVALMVVRRRKTSFCIMQKSQSSISQLPRQTTPILRVMLSEFGDLMQIASIRIFGREGQFEDTLAVCDTGSTQTWVEEDLLDKLELRREHVSRDVTGFQGTQTTCRAVQTTIASANCMQDRGKLLTVHSKKTWRVEQVSTRPKR